MCLQTLKELSQIAVLNAALDKFYNSTFDYHELLITEATGKTNEAKQLQSQLGIVISASNANDVHIYGIKSDKGTTDGYMALPLTVESTEFMIAAWK